MGILTQSESHRVSRSLLLMVQDTCDEARNQDLRLYHNDPAWSFMPKGYKVHPCSWKKSELARDSYAQIRDMEPEQAAPPLLSQAKVLLPYSYKITSHFHSACACHHLRCAGACWAYAAGQTSLQGSFLSPCPLLSRNRAQLSSGSLRLGGLFPSLFLCNQLFITNNSAGSPDSAYQALVSR